MAASTYYAQVQQLYIAYFGRPADTIGLDYWAKNIDAANGSIAAVIAGFSASAESAALFGNTTTAQKVAAIYQNAFGRSPEPAGLAYWVAQLDSGKVSQAQASWTIQQSAGPGDAAAVQNKLVAAQAFTAQIDTTAEILGYQGAAPAASARAYLQTVDSTPASLNAAVAGAAAALAAASTGAVASTFTLTTGIDNFVGTGGNDVFIGGNGAENTFGPADQLDGGAGNDSLRLFGGPATNATFPTIKNIENVYLNATTGDLNVSGIAGVTGLELENVGAATFTLAATQALKLSNQVNALTVAGSTAGGITVNGSGTAATPLALTLTSTNAALNLTTATKASVVTLTAPAALTSVKIAGDQALALTANSATLVSVDASANTAGVNYTNTTAADLTFVGGAGTDRVNVGATLTAADKLDGGAGIDTLAITGATSLTTAAVANVKGFEVLETVGTTTQDASVFAPANVLSGLTVGAVAAGTAYTTVVTNLAATAKDNIKVSDTAAASNVTVSVKDFVSGGTSDTATVTYTGAVKTGASTLNFDNVDVLNLVSTSTVAGTSNSIILNATDLEKLVVTGTIATTVNGGNSTGITEVDASGLKVGAGTVGLTFTQAAGSTQNLLVTGTNGNDTVTVVSAKGTVIGNGGNDTVNFTADTTVVGDQSVKLSAVDFVAGGNTTVAFTANTIAAAAGVIDFTSAIENTLKVGGVNLGTTTSNVAIGTDLSANTNVAFNAGVLQIDLNGDGVFTAGTDFAVTLTGVAAVNYNAAADIFTVA